MTLVLLPCHGVYDADRDELISEHARDRVTHEAQLRRAAAHALAVDDALLVLSGGPTKVELELSEARSYVRLAERIGAALPPKVELEEYALTSIENLLFGAYAYRRARGSYPPAIHVVGWGFKEQRMRATLAAIHSWEDAPFRFEEFVYVSEGALDEGALAAAEPTERAYVAALERGLDAYYASADVQAVLARRDPWGSRERVRQAYSPLPF